MPKFWNENYAPPDSIRDFVLSLRQQAEGKNGPFRWPSTRLTFQKALEVALHFYPLVTWLIFATTNLIRLERHIPFGRIVELGLRLSSKSWLKA